MGRWGIAASKHGTQLAINMKNYNKNYSNEVKLLLLYYILTKKRILPIINHQESFLNINTALYSFASNFIYCEHVYNVNYIIKILSSLSTYTYKFNIGI